jgi:hypothetical protein
MVVAEVHDVIADHAATLTRFGQGGHTTYNTILILFTFFYLHYRSFTYTHIIYTKNRPNDKQSSLTFAILNPDQLRKRAVYKRIPRRILGL